MSNTIAHLVVAQRIYLKLQKNVSENCNQNSGTDMYAYYLGAIAPDTIGSKPECTREDKRRVHLREDIRDSEWLTDEKMEVFEERVKEYVDIHIRLLVNSYMQSDEKSHSYLDENTHMQQEEHFHGNPHEMPSKQNLEEKQIAFNIGYLVHLLTDKWNHKTIRQSLLKVAKENGVQESDREFFHMCVNDLEALDNYLLNKYPETREVFFRLIEMPVEDCLSQRMEQEYIRKEYIQSSMKWWKDNYLPSIKTRELKYITEADIEAFIDVAENEIIHEIKEYGLI